MVSTTIDQYILLIGWGVSALVMFLLWLAGFVACLRSRPAPGRTFLAIGFGLFMFVSFLGIFDMAMILLQMSDLLAFDPFSSFGGNYVYVGYQMLRALIQFVAVTAIVIGTIQSLHYTGHG